MLWAKVALAGGLALLLSGFGMGVEPTSASLGDRTYHCGTVIPASWLLSGTTADSASPRRTAERVVERQGHAACLAVARRTRVLTWGALGVGSILLLVGGTALRERGASGPDRPALL